MNSRYIVISLIVLFFFTCCEYKHKTQRKLNNKLDIKIEKCIKNNLSDGTQDIFKASSIIEEYLLKHKYLRNNQKYSYKQLVYSLLSNQVSFDKDFHNKLKNEVFIITSPKVLSVINFCFKKNIKNNNIKYYNETAIEFSKLLVNIIRVGDLGNQEFINEYFSLLSDNEFQKPEYKIFIIYLICNIEISQ